MKILCLSDLHLGQQEIIRALDNGVLSPLVAKIKGAVAETNPDAVVLTGDTISSAQVRLLSAVLKILVPDDIPVIATLGNHEFWGQTFEETLKNSKSRLFKIPTSFILTLLAALNWAA